MPGVGRAADVTDVGGAGRRANAADEAAAAEVLQPAIPGALHATGAAIGRAQRQPNPDIDRLIFVSAIAKGSVLQGSAAAGAPYCGVGQLNVAVCRIGSRGRHQSGGDRWVEGAIVSRRR